MLWGMSEHARARAVAVSMSLLSAGLLSAVLIGLVLVSGGASGTIGGAGGRTIGLYVPAERVKATPRTTVVIIPAPGTGTVAGNVTPPRGPRHASPRHHRDAPKPRPRPVPHTSDGGPPVSVGGGVDVGPVHVKAKVGVGSKGVDVDVEAGPVHVKTKVDAGPVGDAVGDVTAAVCQLLC
jgi:hypothetical protein